jgi:hypothetical protein
VSDDTLSDDTLLPKDVEGSDLVNEQATDNEDGKVQPDDTTGREFPKNEFEQLKETLLGTDPTTKIDEVTVNEDVIGDEEVNDGTLFHEHTNYDTTVLNFPGGPYLTDVDNARTAAYVERREAQSDGDEDKVASLDLASAQTEADVTQNMLQQDEANSAIAAREDKLRQANEAQVIPGMIENAQTGKSVEDILADSGTTVETSPSGVNPPPAPEETVPGLTVHEGTGSLDTPDGTDAPEEDPNRNTVEGI